MIHNGLDAHWIAFGLVVAIVNDMEFWIWNKNLILINVTKN
jgi:hypothetical protein